MTTGYVAIGGADLDALFKARTSSPAAATNYKSNGGVDLNQRFEPRGAVTPIADTGFKVSGTDLSQIFQNISGVTPTTGNLTAGQSASLIGYQDVALGTAIGSTTIGLVGTNNLLRLYFNGIASRNSVAIGNGSSAPADADTTWLRIEVTGTWSGGTTETRTLVRASALGTATGSGGGFSYRTWDVNPTAGAPLVFVNANVYSVVIYRT